MFATARSRLLIPCLAALALGAAACDKDAASAAPDAAAPATPATPEPGGEETATLDVSSIASILAGSHRTDEHRARDQYRHPAETLAFFGVDKSDTVVELWPGGGWYTDVLAPWLRDEGKLIITSYDPGGDPEFYGTKQANAWAEKVETQPDLYGKVETVMIAEPLVLGEPGSVDVVLTFRNSHGWFNGGKEKEIYKAAFDALKPGGTFGLVQHRAPEGGDAKEWAEKGYLPEQAVIDAAKAVGFELAEKSEINANPKDTKDHEKGVWTLPPGLALGDQDKDKYLEMGESDRMTLKFVKPAA